MQFIQACCMPFGDFISRRRFSIGMACLLTVSLVGQVETAVKADGEVLRIATFNVDATPPIGSPVAYAAARTVEDPLSARGIILLGAGDPIVMCAVDWIGIGNLGHDVFREKLAAAAGTTRDRVAVHTLHQHDGVRCDFRADDLMSEIGIGGTRYDNAFCRSVLENAGVAIKAAIPKAQPVTHLGVGKAIVDQVASNRRVLGEDGKVKFVRYSSAAKNPIARDAPEGLIDPELKLISFWNGDTPLASLTYYTTHPMSYYGKGDITTDFIGLARARREKTLPNVAHIHFNGGSGNITAGKYNDGTPELRVLLTDRVEDGMKRAWDATKKTPVSATQVSWQSNVVQVPVAAHLDEAKLRATINNNGRNEATLNAPKVAWLERAENNAVPIDLSCLKIGDVAILHMPGELFVEYQLAAAKMLPGKTVCLAAYGDYGPCYIPTEIAFTQGGYEVGNTATNVAPQTERVLMKGISELLTGSSEAGNVKLGQ